MIARAALPLLLAAALCACQARRFLEPDDEAVPREMREPLRLAELALRAGDAEAARQGFEQVIAAAPDCFRALRGQQEALLAQGRRDAALQIARSRLDAKGDAQAHLLMARIAESDGAPEEADADLARALELDPRSHWARYAQALRFAAQSDFEKAEDALDAALGEWAGFEEARLARARVRATRAEFADAADDYRDYLDAEPTDAAALQELATLLHRELAEPEQAEKLYEQLHALDPTSTAAIVGLAVRAAEKGDYAAAEHRYLEIEDREPVALFNLGLLYYRKLDRLEDARRCFVAFRDWQGEKSHELRVEDRYILAPIYIEEIGRLLAAKPGGGR